MKLSLFMMPLHNKEKPFAQQLAEDAEAFLLADELGYHEAWCGEHYSSSTEAISSPLMFFASLIPRTRQITFCTGVACLPQYHPAIYAGHAALFDHLSGGRFIFGIGTGGLQSDMEMFDTFDKNRPDMLREAIDQILKIWTTDPPYDIQGKFWNTKIRDYHLEDLGLGHFAKPLQQPHPPIAITASSANSGSMKAAGLRGWIPVTANFIGAWSAKTHWQVYESAAQTAGHRVSREDWRIARSIHVDESDAKAEAFVKAKDSPFDHYYRYLFTLWSHDNIQGAFLPSPELKACDADYAMLRDNYVIWGSPATVTRKLLEFREEVGHFGHVLMTGHDWTDKDKMRRSMVLMAREVLPSVNKAIGALV
ncbi:MAG: LLM class flavin-dependent oxidoreductase [Methylobacteriaceae bacterium]|nr:LLM class flavin-dependent oxidoreductase [Methylobacteriaceae bacterium]